MNTICWLRTCRRDFDWHELAVREFVREHGGKMPLQRRAPGVGPHEEHLGQWWRSQLALVRTKGRLLDPTKAARIGALSELHTGAGRRPHAHATRCSSDLERASLIVAFVEEYQRMPRISGVDVDPERRAGRTLNTLRSRARGLGARKVRPIDADALALLEERLSDWRGPRAKASARDTRAVRASLRAAS